MKNNSGGAAKKTSILKNVVTEPGLAMIGAHVLLSVAAGGAALITALTTFAATAALKLTKETGLADRIKNNKLKNLITTQNTPMRMAGIGLTALCALSFMNGSPLLGLAFAMFGSGNLIFNTPFTKRFPVDNALFTIGSCTTAFIAGGSLLPWLAIVPAGILSTYNLMKSKGDRNLGRPKLWFAGAQATSAILGFTSGQPERLLPALAMLSVTWGYGMMEIRQTGNGDKSGNQNKNGDRFDISSSPGTGPTVKNHPSVQKKAGLDGAAPINRAFTAANNDDDEPESPAAGIRTDKISGPQKKRAP